MRNLIQGAISKARLSSKGQTLSKASLCRAVYREGGCSAQSELVTNRPARMRMASARTCSLPVLTSGLTAGHNPAARRNRDGSRGGGGCCCCFGSCHQPGRPQERCLSRPGLSGSGSPGSGRHQGPIQSGSSPPGVQGERHRPVPAPRRTPRVRRDGAARARARAADRGGAAAPPDAAHGAAHEPDQALRARHRPHLPAQASGGPAADHAVPGSAAKFPARRAQLRITRRGAPAEVPALADARRWGVSAARPIPSASLSAARGV